MSSPLLLAELYRLVEDPRLLRAAEEVLTHLRSSDCAARRRQLREPAERDREFERLWETYIEPSGSESLNSGEGASPGLTVRMAHQGVVFDHIIRL